MIPSIRFTLDSRSTKKLDAFTSTIVTICKDTRATIKGPVCFKGRRLIIISNYNGNTIDQLLKINCPSKVICTIDNRY